MKKKLLFLSAFIIIVGFSACKKDKKDPDPVKEEPAPVNQNGSLKIQFDNMVDALPLVFNQNYVNPKTDTFKVTKFNYYISNIVVTKSDNSVYTESNSYHLIEHSNPASGLITLTNVPPGSYKSISFVLGVDSARNCSGAQSGDLDPAKGMFWTWSSGYIMFKLEGYAPKSGAGNKFIEYHIGGFGGINKAQRSFNNLSFNAATADVTTTGTPTVYLKTDVNELFKSPTLIDFTTQYSQVSSGSAAKIYADNYADMISFNKVTN